jgi:hypothetical protein
MHEHFDAQKALGHIAELSAMRRLAGTPGEALAQEYIRGAGRDADIEMHDEDFAYTELPLKLALPAMCLIIGSISVMGSLAYLWGTSLVLIPGAALLVAVYFGFKWSSTFEKFASKGSKHSVNLVGRIPGIEPRGTVMLSAHYDSKSQIMPVILRASFFMIGFATAILLGLTLVAVGILKAGGHGFLGSHIGFFISLVPPALMLGLILNVTGNRSPGALDDASGVAVILEAGRVLAGSPLHNFDTVVAAFGCEEVGLCGSISYLLAHEDELRRRPFFMLNFDMPFTSSGNLMLNTGFEFPPVRTSMRLNETARRVGKAMGVKVSGGYLPVGAGADHMPWVKHGFEATGLVSAATNIHSSRDSLDKVNREGLRRAGEATIEILRQLDQGASSLSKKPGPDVPEAAAPSEERAPD